MAKVSAHSKRTDQKYMSLLEYHDLGNLTEFRHDFKAKTKGILGGFKIFNGTKALNRLNAQAKREGISPLEKLCRLERKARALSKR